MFYNKFQALSFYILLQEITETYSRMSSNHIQALASMSQVDNTNSPKPTQFDDLPAEIRIKIWKLTFQPRRVILMRAGDRPPIPADSIYFVNFEARQVFLETYTKCFHELGQKPLYLNFDLDTLCFASGLKGFKKMLKQYPDGMGKVKYIDIRSGPTDNSVPELGWRPNALNLHVLKSLQRLMVRKDVGIYQRPKLHYFRPNLPQESTFHYLTDGLFETQQTGVWSDSMMPKIAMMYLPTDRENLGDSDEYDIGASYVETSADGRRERYGRVRDGDHLFGNFQVQLQIPFRHVSIQPGDHEILFGRKLVDDLRSMLDDELTPDEDSQLVIDHLKSYFDTELKNINLHWRWAKRWQSEHFTTEAQEAELDRVLLQRIVNATSKAKRFALELESDEFAEELAWFRNPDEIF